MLCVEFDTQEPEMLIALLTEYSFEGFQEFDNSVLAYISNNDWASVQKDVMMTIGAVGVVKKIAPLPEKNWNAVWEASFSPVIIDDFCAIRASFHEPIRTCQHEMIIDPKMAFGTGHHETTELMIHQMRNIDFAGKTVLDLGCGTGILAILAAKLGATDITAVDNDPEAVNSARENAAINAVKINSIYGTATDLASNAFDVVLANINRNILVGIMPDMKRILRNNGLLLMSGILIEAKEIISQTVQMQQFQLLKEQSLGEWLSLLVKEG